MPDSIRTLAARAAAHTRWSREADPQAAVAPARRGFLARFEREVDPDGTLPPEELAVRAERAMKAHMSKLAARSVRSRRKASAR